MADATSFGRYKVTGTLGAGAMGQVYAAVDEVLGREVAVKTLHGKLPGLGGQILDERFRLEARAIAALTHPGIVQVFDIDLAADPPYLVMERVAGPSLKERFASGPLPESELRALGIQIARALAAAHAARIVHRDVKPANILIAGPGTWKLADFGVAHVPDSSLTLTGQFVGSPAYAPPEALLRGQADAAGDVFGLGATLYVGAAGRWPRAEATTGALLAPVPSLRELAPHLPADLIAAIDRALAVEPDQRPTAAELADALAGSVAREVPSAPQPLRWRPWAIGAAALVALVGIIAATREPSAPSQAPATPATPVEVAPASAPPDTIHVATPPISDPKAAKDWNKLVDKLHEQKFGEAKRKLDEWEHRWGETDETRDLRSQLDALPDDPPGPDHGPPDHGPGPPDRGPDHGPGKKHGRGD